MDVVMGDDVKDKLLTNNEECTMNLINLLLTGRATKNLHNGNIIFDGDGKLLVSYSVLVFAYLWIWQVNTTITNQPLSRRGNTETGILLRHIQKEEDNKQWNWSWFALFARLIWVKLRKSDKMRGLPSIWLPFCTKFNKFNNTGARMVDSIFIIWH